MQQVLSLATQVKSEAAWVVRCLLLHHQLVLTLAPLQDSDNPDLRDRGYIYWRLLSTDPVTAKEVVLSEKPLISEETDLIEPTLLDELICHIGSLASVYHKPPSAFVEGSHGIHRKHLPVQHSRSAAAIVSPEPLRPSSVSPNVWDKESESFYSSNIPSVTVLILERVQ